MRQSLVILLLFLLPMGAFAGADSFECKVSVAYVVSEDGALMTDTPHLKELIGSTFSVNRKSGEIRPIRGSYSYLLTNEWSTHTSVIDSGPGADYYVISVSWGPKISVGYLFIETFRSKTAQKQKPFTFTAGGGYFYAGLCW